MSSDHAKLPFIAYQGDEPFLFVSYSHADAEAVYEEILWLHGQGVNVWYDEGISPGQSWPRELATTLNRCSLVLVFISENSMVSANCLREIHFAVERDKAILAIHLDDSKLPDDWQFAIGDRQAILKERLTRAMYREKLLAAITEFITPTAARIDSSSPVATTGLIDTAERRSPTQDPEDESKQSNPRGRWLAVSGVLLLCMVAASYWVVNRLGEQRWLDEDALPALNAMMDRDQYDHAYRLAVEIEERAGPEAVSAAIWETVAAVVDVETTPPGANVSWRFYGNVESPWTPLGETPLAKVRLPAGQLELRFEKSGHASRHLTTAVPGVLVKRSGTSLPAVMLKSLLGGSAPQITLFESSVVPEDMVVVDASPARLGAFNFGLPLRTPAFLIERLETTNARYQEFVDDGGYRAAEYWDGLEFTDGDQVLSWREAVARFVDSTGRPGPAHWELGRHPDGEANLPVHGVSWYEAMAYARYRGRSLPPIQFWARATIAIAEPVFPNTPAMVVQSNFSGALTQVGSTGALGPNGTVDTAGNVAEWMYNASGSNRFIMGGNATQPPYVFYNRDQVRSPWDRGSMIGIRCFKSLGPVDAEYLAAFAPTVVPEAAAPMSSEAFATDVSSYDYVSFDPDARTQSTTAIPGGVLRVLTLRSGSGEERFTVNLFTPERVQPPYQALLLMGGAGGLQPGSRQQVLGHPNYEILIQQVLRSGRAVIWPEWYGYYGRHDNMASLPAEQRPAAWRQRHLSWRKETDAIIRHLLSTGEFANELGWLGYSSGASYPVPRILYQVPEIKTAILIVGGHGISQPADASYVANVDKPVLMLNGRFDSLASPWLSERLYETLGTAAEDKKLVFYDMGHALPPRNQLVREMDDWLNKYLGPVNR